MAGLDMEFPDRLGYSDTLAVMFCDGRADATWLDRAVLRVLTLKFELGLFDDPFPEWEEYSVSLADTGAAERVATRQTLTLTKNEGLLPLRDKNARIAVIGPCAGSLASFVRRLYLPLHAGDVPGRGRFLRDGRRCADRPRRAPDANTTSPPPTAPCARPAPRRKRSLRHSCARFPHCSWTQGCDYLDPASQDIPAACAAARSADAVVLCLGGKNGWGRHCNTGEGNDSASLDLPGAQKALARAVIAENANTVVVHTDGRPLTSEWIYDHSAAVLEAYMPGAWGGEAIAAAIAGEFSPAGVCPSHCLARQAMAPCSTLSTTAPRATVSPLARSTVTAICSA